MGDLTFVPSKPDVRTKVDRSTMMDQGGLHRSNSPASTSTTNSMKEEEMKHTVKARDDGVPSAHRGFHDLSPSRLIQRVALSPTQRATEVSTTLTMGFKPTADRSDEITSSSSLPNKPEIKLPESIRRPHRPLPLANSTSDQNSVQAKKVSLALPSENQQPGASSSSASPQQLPSTQQTTTTPAVAPSEEVSKTEKPSSEQKPSASTAPMTQGNPQQKLILQSESRSMSIELPTSTPEPLSSSPTKTLAAAAVVVVPSSAASVESSTSSQQAQPHETPKSNKRKKSPPARGISAGRWTDSEHQTFLKGLQLYGREWKKVASHIPTRTSAQVRSHAQKYFTKMQRDQDAFLILSSHHSHQQQEQQHPTSSAAAAEQQSSNNALGQAASSSSLSPATSFENSTEGLPPGIQATVARILANPESVEAEVEDTLQRLRERYRLLQARLQQTDQQQPQPHHPHHHHHHHHHHHRHQKPSPFQTGDRKRPAIDAASLGSVASSTLQDEELIAVSVLQAALPQSGNNSRASAAEEDETADDNTTHSNNSNKSNKRSRMSSF